jgi:hypothetical protein
MKTSYTKEYKEAFIKVRQVINELDPIGLINICPENEYDMEIGDILSNLKKCKTVENTTLMLEDVFIKWFGSIAPKGIYEETAKKLFTIKVSYSWLNE